MKLKHSIGDEFAYTIACIVTLGFAWFLRAIISVAIRRAFMTPTEEKKSEELEK